ncbi:MAG TPA: CapA family protein [Candidatus Paceibacterota bacterium]|nr:CapA family protein [Candidatus Paceibacterota bacterium]
MNKKYIFICLIIIASIAGSLTGLAVAKKLINIKENNLTAQVLENTNITPVQQIPDTTLFFVGDMMLDRSVKSSVIKNFNGDYSKLFTNLEDLKSADILFANLEGDVSDVGNNVGSIYSFRMDPKVLPAIKDAGFDIVSFANNHAGDWNIKAFKDTLLRLQDIGILETGAGMTEAEAEAPAIIEKNGVKFGFIGFSDVGPDWLAAKDNAPGILLASDPNLPDIIKNAKANCDVLIVSFHWGIEYKTIHNKRQETLAHTAIDNGADMVIGSHPHVMEDIETYNNRPIVYSLGNFIFDQSFSKDTMHGMLFEAVFSGNKLKSTTQKIIELNEFYQPEGIFDWQDQITNKPETQKIFSCPKPTKEYEDETYLNIDQTVNLPDASYIPSDLEKLPKNISTSNICLIKEAKDALEDMLEAASEAGYTIVASSGFRDYDTQKGIFDNDLKTKNIDVSNSVAKPGFSEHQLGVAVDLTSKSIAYASASGKFENTNEAKWLEANAYLYGFIQSYPKGKEDITGYMYEPWHYRYVGVENALEIIKTGETVNQFLKDKIDQETL